MDINNYHIFFMKNKYDNKRNNSFKIKKKKQYSIYDKLFFNFLNIIRYKDLDMYYDKNKEKMIKYSITQQLENIKLSKKDEISEILCYQDNINLFVLNALSEYFKMNIIYIHENIYIKMYYNNNSQQYFILNNMKDFKQIQHDKIEQLIENKYQIYNIYKPINSLTYYRLEELKLIYEKINGHNGHNGDNGDNGDNNDNKLKKKDYYDFIKEYILNCIDI